MLNDKFQENLSRPGIIDARDRYRAAARRLRNTAVEDRALDAGESVTGPHSGGKSKPPTTEPN